LSCSVWDLYRISRRKWKYEGTLGADAWKNENTGVQERVKGYKMKLHWSMIERKEVDEL
jgi:hypothetical protein